MEPEKTTESHNNSFDNAELCSFLIVMYLGFQNNIY